MTELYTGRVTLTIDDDPIPNVKTIKWRRVGAPVTPRFNSSHRSAVGWLLGHYNIEGEFNVVSAADLTLDEAFDATVDAELTSGESITYTFTEFIITGTEPSFDETSDRNPVTLVKFLAASVSKEAEEPPSP